MRLRLVLSIIICILFFEVSYTQENLNSQLHAIKFVGQKKTSVSYLSKHVESQVGASITDSLILQDVQRLKNLSSTGNVNYHIEEVDGKKILIFDIEEVRTLLPILNAGGIKNNFWFQVGFTDINWGGKGHNFSGSYLNNDNRHSGNIFYRIPRIKNSNWGVSVAISSWSSLEPLFFDEGTVTYEYGNDGINLTGIYHFDYNRNLEFGGTFFVENYERSEEQFSEILVGPDQFRQPKWLGKIGYKENFINSHFFYLFGFSWSAAYQVVLNSVDQTFFNSIELETKWFARVKEKGNFAHRLRVAFATNNDSPFAPFVADSHVNIRGIGNRIDRGTAQIILNTEYRHAFVENEKWGFQGVTFSDIGTWRNPGEELNQIIDPDQFRFFFGGGIRLIYNKISGAVLRIDYAVDIFNTEEKGVVIGLGQYF